MSCEGRPGHHSIKARGSRCLLKFDLHVRKEADQFHCTRLLVGFQYLREGDWVEPLSMKIDYYQGRGITPNSFEDGFRAARERDRSADLLRRSANFRREEKIIDDCDYIPAHNGDINFSLWRFHVVSYKVAAKEVPLSNSMFLIHTSL